MATVAEILANPSSFSPETVLRAAIKKYGGDVKKIVAYFKAKGMVIQPGDVKRWLKGNVKRKPAKGKKRVVKKKAKKAKKKTKGKRKSAGPAKWKVSYLKGRKKKGLTAEQKRNKKMTAKFGEGWADDYSAFADAQVGKPVKKKKKKKKTTTKKARKPMAKKKKATKAKTHKKTASLKGKKVRGRFTGKIANRVGSRVSDDVAMNPSFGGIASLFSNPALDLSLEGIGNNLFQGGQSAVGAVGGMLASKYARDLLISKIIQKDSAAPTMVQRLVSGVAAMVVMPPLVRAVLPNRLGDNLARGIVTGAGLYIVSGIEIGGKKLLPIGEMVGEEQEIIIDSEVGAEYTARPRGEIDAEADQTISADYTMRERGEVQAYEDGIELQDEMAGEVGYPTVGDGVTEFAEEVF